MSVKPLAPAAASPLAVGMVAGETSGDLLASAVLSGLRARSSRVNAFGVGGPQLRAAGMDTWEDISQLSVRGYAEVVAALPRLLLLRASLRKRMESLRPDVFLGVDAPDFNLALETTLRRAGIKTVHFISPSIWAWRAERIEAIRRAVDHMLLVFPFEQSIYDTAGIPATYVGHPLADQLEPVLDTAPARKALELSASAPTIALLPGSRPDEIRYMAKRFIETASWLYRQRRDLQFVLPAASAEVFASLKGLLERHRDLPSLPLKLISGQSHQAMAAADVVLVASGTATLEAALLGKPMTICYRMSPISYRLMRNKGLLPWIGLPNILCREPLVPELIQDDATPQALGSSVLLQIDDIKRRHYLLQRFTELHGGLRRDCAARSAEVLMRLCAKIS